MGTIYTPSKHHSSLHRSHLTTSLALACESHQLTPLSQPSQVHRSSEKPPAHHQKVFGAFPLYGVMTNSSTTQCKENQYMQVVGKESFIVCPNYKFPLHLPLLHRSSSIPTLIVPHTNSSSRDLIFSSHLLQHQVCPVYTDKHASKHSDTHTYERKSKNYKNKRTKMAKCTGGIRRQPSVSPVGRCTGWFPVCSLCKYPLFTSSRKYN